MSRIAISGHRGLPEHTEHPVDAALRREIGQRVDGELVGHSCIADGPDSLFGRALLDAGGRLIVIVPAEKYREGLPVEHHPVYDALMARASDVIRLDHIGSTSESPTNASVRMIEQADELIAAWDGKPARGYGGTADDVEAARERGRPRLIRSKHAFLHTSGRSCRCPESTARMSEVVCTLASDVSGAGRGVRTPDGRGLPPFAVHARMSGRELCAER